METEITGIAEVVRKGGRWAIVVKFPHIPYSEIRGFTKYPWGITNQRNFIDIIKGDNVQCSIWLEQNPTQEKLSTLKSKKGDMMETVTTKEDAYKVILEARLALCRLKNRDYGDGNIATTGLLGIAVRLVDKAMRLYNLAQSYEKTMPAAARRVETIEDTLADIANYADIGILLRKGWWGLPWRENE